MEEKSETRLRYQSERSKCEGGIVQITILDWFSPQGRKEKSNFTSQNPELDWSKATKNAARLTCGLELYNKKQVQF